MTESGVSAAEPDKQLTDLSSNEPEFRYFANSDLAHRKKLGQFFTPYSVACFMGQWLTEISVTEPEVLDPCAGLGVFERALCSTDPDFAARARFTLWEIDRGLSKDLSRICERLDIHHSVINKDFVDEHSWAAAYDAIIGNPPYYKHHFVRNKEDVRDIVSSSVGTSFSVQTNVYCWFLIKALALLKPGGRLAFIIPTEFLNSNYGRAVKEYLLKTSTLRHIISICYKSRPFDDAITTACVILAEKGVEPTDRIRFYSADSHEGLDRLPKFLADTQFIEYETGALDSRCKWRSLFPGNTRIDTKKVCLVPFSTYGWFSRGIATGANEFFSIRPSRADEYGLPTDCLIPCLSKARQAPGKRFTEQDFESLRRADKPVYLFDGEALRGEAVERYIRSGEELGFHTRYLTKTRKPWYALEKRPTSNIWVGVFSRAGIRFIWNESDCISLTCFHVFQPSQAGERYLPFLFLYLNSRTGRTLLELEKREYGGGLEKYEPNDINKSLAPDFRLLNAENSKRLVELQEAFINAEKGSPEEKSVLIDADAIFDSLIRLSHCGV